MQGRVSLSHPQQHPSMIINVAHFVANKPELSGALTDLRAEHQCTEYQIITNSPRGFSAICFAKQEQIEGSVCGKLAQHRA